MAFPLRSCTIQPPCTSGTYVVLCPTHPRVLRGAGGVCTRAGAGAGAGRQGAGGTRYGAAAAGPATQAVREGPVPRAPRACGLWRTQSRAARLDLHRRAVAAKTGLTLPKAEVT